MPEALDPSYNKLQPAQSHADGDRIMPRSRGATRFNPHARSAGVAIRSPSSLGGRSGMRRGILTRHRGKAPVAAAFCRPPGRISIPITGACSTLAHFRQMKVHMCHRQPRLETMQSASGARQAISEPSRAEVIAILQSIVSARRSDRPVLPQRSSRFEDHMKHT